MGTNQPSGTSSNIINLLDPTAGWDALEKHHHMDGAPDAPRETLSRGRIGTFRCQVFEPLKGLFHTVGMHRAQPARVPGIPGFDHLMGCPVNHLADNDAVGATLERVLYEVT